jgi:hypothetical protein
LAPNTVVVMPKPLPMNKGWLAVLVACLAFLGGLLVHEAIVGGDVAPVSAGGSSAGGSSAATPAGVATADPFYLLLSTVVAQNESALHPSPTPSPTTWATLAATTDPYTNYDPRVATPGLVYRQPPPTTVPRSPTPMLSCGDPHLSTSEYCLAPTWTPTPTPRAVSPFGLTGIVVVAVPVDSTDGGSHFEQAELFTEED